MNTEDWLNQATSQLEAADIGTARLDCLVLLGDLTDKNRAWLLAHSEFELSSQQLAKLNKKVAQRVEHTPLAYIRGFTEFYGRKFAITPDVLEPRPESETMIELLKDIVARHETRDSSRKNSQLETRDPRLSVIDVGTGSGALAITAKLELPKTEVTAIDIDPKCLKIAKQNAKTLNAEIVFFQGDLLTPLGSRVYNLPSVILANLPYVPRSWRINRAAEQEPRIAIDGGSDGIDVYRRLFDQIKELSGPPRYVLTEALPPTHKNLAQLARLAGYRQLKSQDFVQVFCRISNS